MLVAIINHGLVAEALVSAQARALPHGATIVIDSGSELTPSERMQCDFALPNVFYSGLLNPDSAVIPAEYRARC